MRNRERLERSERAGCFYCVAIFSPTEIRDWIPERATDGSDDLDEGVTALCPHCGIDSVLPSNAPIEISAPVLTQMRHHWFERTLPASAI